MAVCMSQSEYIHCVTLLLGLKSAEVLLDLMPKPIQFL